MVLYQMLIAVQSEVNAKFSEKDPLGGLCCINGRDRMKTIKVNLIFQTDRSCS